MDVATSITGAAGLSAAGGVFPSGYAVLLWAPLTVIVMGLLVWLAALISIQGWQRRNAARAARSELRWGWIKRALARPVAHPHAAWRADA